MASPAQIANDMAAHAAYWTKRDRDIERACRDAAWVIRAFLTGDRVDGRTYWGVDRRLSNLADRKPDWGVQGYPDFDRARICMQRLKAEAGH